MTNQNNASETSGELLGVAEWIVHEYPKVADILTSTAETIKRLVAERDKWEKSYRNEQVLSRSYREYAAEKSNQYVAAKKRIVELEAQYQQAREALEEVDNLLADYDLRFLSKTEVISALRDLKGKQP